MTEKIHMISKCERCGIEEQQEIKPFLKILLRKPKRPKNWKVLNDTELCSNCVTEHDQLYKKLWIDFLDVKKK